MLAQDLSTLLQLDRKKLYVFVAGPGKGEAVAVALPQAGWLLVDGCRAALAQAGEDLPLGAIFARWAAGAGDAVSVVLTHPHRDHSDGFARLVDRYNPDAVGIVACPAANEHPLDDALRWIASDRPATGYQRNKLGSERAAIRSIIEWERRHPGALKILQDGTSMPTGGSPAKVCAIAPSVDGLKAFWIGNDLKSRYSTKANHVSAVCEVEYGGTRVVLTGDLPYTSAGKPIPTGWERVAKDHPIVSAHSGLKIPHHGSLEALHPGWMGDGSVERNWVVTPFNSSELPGLADGEGLSELLKKQKTVRLTSLPASREVQAATPIPGRVEFSQLKRRREGLKTGIPFIDEGIDVKPGTACGPLDAVWAFEFDDAGAMTGLWRGSASLEVFRAPKIPPGLVHHPKGGKA